jgi:hypothetical protein
VQIASDARGPALRRRPVRDQDLRQAGGVVQEPVDIVDGQVDGPEPPDPPGRRYLIPRVVPKAGCLIHCGRPDQPDPVAIADRLHSQPAQSRHPPYAQRLVLRHVTKGRTLPRGRRKPGDDGVYRCSPEQRC